MQSFRGGQRRPKLERNVPQRKRRGEKGVCPSPSSFMPARQASGQGFHEERKSHGRPCCKWKSPNAKPFASMVKKNAQVFYRSRLLKRLQFSNINAKMKKQGLFLLGVRPSCLRISPLLTLDSLEIGVQEIAERAIAYVVGGGASAQMSGEAVTQLFPLISTCQ